MFKESDIYLTPEWLCDLVADLWGGVGLDPFHHPESFMRARKVIDIRSNGDAYRDLWDEKTALVNGPYSGKNPVRTAKRCIDQARRNGIEIFSVCPSAPGSDYWRRYIWPHAAAITWLGRLPFPKPGSTAKNGNRTEVAGVLLGRGALAFARSFARKGYVTTIQKTVWHRP